jgi:hypothetical protein
MGRSGGLKEFWVLTGLTFQQSYATIELPLIGCPPQPVRGIFLNKVGNSSGLSDCTLGRKWQPGMSFIASLP